MATGLVNQYGGGFGFDAAASKPPVLGGLGGSSSSGGATSLQQTASKQAASITQQGTIKARETNTEVGSKAGTQRESKTGTRAGTTKETQSFNLDTMDPTSRKALEALLSTLQAGGSTQYKRQQELFMKTLNDLYSSVQQLDPSKAAQMASGNVADLARQLREQQLPAIMQAQESAGLSGDAVSALLANDATSRTAEAQQRAQLEAMIGMGNLQTQAAGTLIEGARSPDQNIASLLSAIGMGKDSVKTGTMDTTGSTREVARENTVGSTTENSFLSAIKDTNQESQSFSSQITDLLSRQQASSSNPQNDLLAKLAMAQALLPAGQSLAGKGGGVLPSYYGGQNAMGAQSSALGLVGL